MVQYSGTLKKKQLNKGILLYNSASFALPSHPKIASELLWPTNPTLESSSNSF